MKTQKAFRKAMLIFTLAGFLCHPAIADTQVIEVWGPTGEGAGLYIKAGDVIISISFPEGVTTNELAQSIWESLHGKGGFTVMRAGNKLYITHNSKITLEKVNISNTRINSSSYNNGQAQFARNNMFHLSGIAVGDGEIHLSNGDLSVSLPTFPGQTAMEIVSSLTDALHEICPDDGLYSFGMEFCIASLNQPDIPVETVDLGIWALGDRNLRLTECTSSDSGVTVYQEPVTIEEIPTLTEWGLIFLVLATMGIGVFRIYC